MEGEEWRGSLIDALQTMCGITALGLVSYQLRLAGALVHVCQLHITALHADVLSVSLLP
jgi:hypothetical protein